MTKTLFEKTGPRRSFISVSSSNDVWTRNNKTVRLGVHFQRDGDAWSVGIVLWRIYALAGRFHAPNTSVIGAESIELKWLVVPAWFIVLWVHACVLCAVYGLHVGFTVPMIFIPLAVILWARVFGHKGGTQ